MKIVKVSLLLVSLLSTGVLHAQERLKMATTTSTENSGLLAELNPVFEKKYDVQLDVISVGTGKALKLGENGDVDLILVHAPNAEKAFVEAGFGVERRAVMHNDFVIVGPKSDPAEVKNTCSLHKAMQRISKTRSTFISRGDDSGTNKKEMLLWKSANLKPQGDWYLSVGQGMGATLKMTNDKQAYTVTDRGTWLAYQDKLDLDILSEGDLVLFNPYHVIAINPKRHSTANYKLAMDYINFITGEEGQKIIENFKINGQRLFHPDAIVD